MKKEQIQKMIEQLTVAEILSNPKLLQAIANDPETDKAYTRAMRVVKDDLSHADVYRLNKVVHSEIVTVANVKESPTSLEWNSLMSMGDHERWFAGFTA